MLSLSTEGIDLLQLRRKLKSIQNDENTFDEAFDSLFTQEGKEISLNTIATLPSLMFNFMKENNLFLNWDQKEQKTHLLYGNFIAYYRRKSLIDESIINDLIHKNEKLEFEIQKMKKKYCFHLNDVCIDIPMNISVLQLQKGYISDWKKGFDEIDLKMEEYMNQEDLRVGLLLQSHAQKNEAFLINYYKWCVIKHDEWCKSDKKWKWCPEHAF